MNEQILEKIKAAHEALKQAKEACRELEAMTADVDWGPLMYGLEGKTKGFESEVSFLCHRADELVKAWSWGD